MIPIIYIYNGPGTSKVSVAHTSYSLKKLYPYCVINALNAYDVISGQWVQDASLFVMPGGADRPYGRALNGAGNNMIQQYVQNGGQYLGICAGAYYACANIKFAVNTDLEVTGARELSFFKGMAVGPTLAPYDYQSNQGARSAVLIGNGVLQALKQTYLTFFNGGCHFVFNEDCVDTKVLAHYQFNYQPAILDIKVGQGRVILSGIHIEYDLDILDRLDPYLEVIYHQLNAGDSKRLGLLSQILNELLGTGD